MYICVQKLADLPRESNLNNLDMATFKAIVGKEPLKDGTHPVYVRVTHHGRSTKITTPIRIEPSQMTRNGKIRDIRITEALEDIIRRYRNIVAELGSVADELALPKLVATLKSGAADGGAASFTLDTVAYIREYAATKSGNTRRNYNTLAASLERFAKGGVLDINAITSQMLSTYEAWLRKEKKEKKEKKEEKKKISPGTITQYLTLLRSAHNAARLRYNDEDVGIVRIPRTPFARYKIPAAPAPVARGIDLETLQKIADMPDESRINSRRNFGRDIFMLSFALGGMNYADIYNMPYSAIHDGYIEYKRQKTRGSRADEALYRVKICEECKPFVTSFFDPAKKRAFKFYHKYTDKSFAMSVSKAIAEVESSVPSSRHYTYYAARHTYASLARNVIGADKYTVHELLNHSDSDMKITDRYIERDWQRLFDIHRKIIALVNWEKLNERANK